MTRSHKSPLVPGGHEQMHSPLLPFPRSLEEAGETRKPPFRHVLFPFAHNPAVIRKCCQSFTRTRSIRQASTQTTREGNRVNDSPKEASSTKARQQECMVRCTVRRCCCTVLSIRADFRGKRELSHNSGCRVRRLIALAYVFLISLLPGAQSQVTKGCRAGQ